MKLTYNLADHPEYAAVLKAMQADLNGKIGKYHDSFDDFVPKNQRPKGKARGKQDNKE